MLSGHFARRHRFQKFPELTLQNSQSGLGLLAMQDPNSRDKDNRKPVSHAALAIAGASHHGFGSVSLAMRTGRKLAPKCNSRPRNDRTATGQTQRSERLKRHIITPSEKAGHDLFAARFFKCHLQLVALNGNHRAIAEFLVEHPFPHHKAADGIHINRDIFGL